MRKPSSTSVRLSAACLAACLWPAPTPTVAAAPPAPSTDAPALRVRKSAPVTLNFVNADVEAVTRAISALIDQPILVDPRVKGTITVYSEQPIPVREAYYNYLAALRGLGFALVDNNGLLKVVPEAEAKLQAGTVSVGTVQTRGDQVITQVFRLNHENPNNLVAVLRPLISPNNTINANAGSSTLVITDYADNLARIGRIIAALDQPAAAEVEVIALQHAVAADLAALLQKLGEGSTAAVPGPQATGTGTSVIVDARSNSLIVRSGSVVRLDNLRRLVAQLDRPGAGPAGDIHVVHLKNADATKLATVLRAAFGATATSGSSAGSSSGLTAPRSLVPSTTATSSTGTTASTISTAATSPVAASAEPSTGGFVQADAATNSLVITAPEPLYRQMLNVIDQLDSRRAQVYIESMIVEVAGGDAADFGFQWLGILGSDGNRSIQAAQNLPSSASPGIISINSDLAQGTVNLGEGLNVGLVRTLNGVTSLTAILRMLQSQSQTNVVSTPNLITLDNEEAKIVVGENVPFITGQFTNTGTSTTNPFQTIERKDVGITLRIRPQIGEGGAIRMQIYQEQSSVKSDTAAGTSNAGPSTTKRSIEGTVTVDDGQILVLGGLIEDNYSTTRSKVPLLGDLPLVGGLFRSESRTRKRTNLMVFLRPVVMRDAGSTARFSLDRYDQIRARQGATQPSPNPLLQVDRAPVLPPTPEASQPIPTAPLDVAPAVPAAPASAAGSAPAR